MKTERGAPDDPILGIRLKGDRMMVAVCWLLWLISLGFAAIYETWVVWAVWATALAGAATALAWVVPGTRVSRVGMSFVLMGFAALTIDQCHGLIEAHFAVFVLLSFLIYYRDPLPIVTGAVFTCLHHLGFCWLQMNGYPAYLFGENHNMAMLFVHAAYVAFDACVLVYMAIMIRGEARESAAIAAFGSRIDGDGAIDLTFDSRLHRGAAARGLTSLLKAIEIFVLQAATLAGRVMQLSREISSSTVSILKLIETEGEHAALAIASVNNMALARARILDECASVVMVTNESAQVVSEGCDMIQQTADNMVRVSETTAHTLTEIGELETETKRIESIVQIMNDIARQSTLLALNANIEAARAGEKGKGFSVVASEIHTLSTRTNESLAEVQSIVDAIGQRVAQLTVKAQHCQTVATLSGSQARAAHAALTQVALDLPGVAKQVESVFGTGGTHRTISDEVLFRMTGIAEAAKQNAQAMKSFAGLTESLDRMSGELSANARYFQPPDSLRRNAA
jgi:methyl-accepting chemotaxis protein